MCGAYVYVYICACMAMYILVSIISTCAHACLDTRYTWYVCIPQSYIQQYVIYVHACSMYKWCVGMHGHHLLNLLDMITMSSLTYFTYLGLCLVNTPGTKKLVILDELDV